MKIEEILTNSCAKIKLSAMYIVFRLFSNSKGQGGSLRDADIKENPVKSGFLQIGGDSESGKTELKDFEHSFC